MAAGAFLRHFLFGAVHLLVAAKTLLMIGAEQRGASVIRLGARGVACAALRHLLFRRKGTVMVAARAQRGIFGVKIGCQSRFVYALGQFLHNFQMLELCRLILFFKQLDLPLFFLGEMANIGGGIVCEYAGVVPIVIS